MKNIMYEYGVTIQDALYAVSLLPKIPPTDNTNLIRSNPNLSWFQKRRLVMELKKQGKRSLQTKCL